MKNTVILMILSSLFLYGCPDYGVEDPGGEEEDLYIINNSNDTIMFDFMNYDFKDENDLVSKLQSCPLTIDLKDNIVYPKSKKVDIAWNFFEDWNWSETYFIYSYSTIKNVPWDTVVLDSMYLKRWDFHSWEQYENADFTLTYP